MRKQWLTFYFMGGSKITADGDCSNEIKGHLPGMKVMTYLDSIVKNRDITLPVTSSKGFLVMYGCESWTLKKAECQQSDAFLLSVGEEP